MGAMIGIDTMILLGAIIWILGEHMQQREGEAAAETLHTPAMRRTVFGLNISVAALVIWLHLIGTVTGITRATFAPNETYVPPEWIASYGPIVFAVTGTFALIFFGKLLDHLWPLAWRYFWVSPDRA